MPKPIPGFIWGVVVDNKDPVGSGRCLISVAGLFEPHHEDWIPIIGWPGSGHPAQGSRYPTPIGAQVALIFEQGDMNSTPLALTGPFGSSKGEPDGTPAAADTFRTGGPDALNDLVIIWEDNLFLCFVTTGDDAAGEPSDRQFVIMDKRTGTNIAINATDGSNKKSSTITLAATTSIVIESKGSIKLDAAQVQIQGRVVQRKPNVTTI
jgi:hypothetical protein